MADAKRSRHKGDSKMRYLISGISAAYFLAIGLILYEQYRFDNLVDECYSLGYKHCIKKDGKLVPSTDDPRIQRELNKFIFWVNKQKSS
jgi:hypothetical protein